MSETATVSTRCTGFNPCTDRCDGETCYGAVVDSLDDMQPVPRAGKFFAELILREEIRTEAGVIVQEGDDPTAEFDVRTKRARVVQLGPPREGETWDFEVGWDVILPYHSGQIFEWMSQARVKESLWIIDAQEPISIFKPR